MNKFALGLHEENIDGNWSEEFVKQAFYQNRTINKELTTQLISFKVRKLRVMLKKTNLKLFLAIKFRRLIE